MVVGGVVASGESWDQGAARELAEETGIVGVPLRFLLAEHAFCPDSVELFGLWRDGRLEP